MIRTFQLGFDVASKHRSIKLQFFVSILFSELKVHYNHENVLHIYDYPFFPPVLFSKVFSVISLEHKHRC